MEKETLYKFFDGKASREEKEAVRIWLESLYKDGPDVILFPISHPDCFHILG